MPFISNFPIGFSNSLSSFIPAFSSNDQPAKLPKIMYYAMRLSRRTCMLPLSIAPLSQCGTAKVFRDPIVNFAYGGRADFRGRHNALYNVLSAPGLSVNVKTEEAVFIAHHGVLTVNGTFLTEAHITAQLSRQKLATASFWASELDPSNFGWQVINGSCVGRPFKFGFHGKKECFDFKMAIGTLERHL